MAVNKFMHSLSRSPTKSIRNSSSTGLSEREGERGALSTADGLIEQKSDIFSIRS